VERKALRRGAGIVIEPKSKGRGAIRALQLCVPRLAPQDGSGQNAASASTSMAKASAGRKALSANCRSPEKNQEQYGDPRRNGLINQWSHRFDRVED
jgi:hypothetical protein